MIIHSGQRVLIWGFGRHGGGQAALRWCQQQGAEVAVLEAKPAAAFGDAAHGLTWHIGDGGHAAVQAADVIIASPAIPPRAWPDRHPPRCSPEGLFCAAHHGPRIAITGTKGKSTTAHILATLLGWEVAGNSYEPLLEVLIRQGPECPIVCELSSFQLWYLSHQPPRFSGALLTSLALDHLDWHPDAAHYHACKLGLLEWAEVIVADPTITLRAGLPLAAPVHFVQGVFRAAEKYLAERADLPLLGEHNARNAALAVAMALSQGLPESQVAERLRLVRGLPHRLEYVPARDARRYLNDSIATTPESAMAALVAIEGPIAIILGGSDKGVSFDALAAAVVARGAIAILIGSTAPRLALALAKAGGEAVLADNLGVAFAAARAATPPGGTVLLSPACASFDQFQGFEDRGERFRALVRAV